MKIVIKEPQLDIGIDDVKPGEFFRFANGANTTSPYLAIERDSQGYQSWLIVRDLASGGLKKFWRTNKERRVTLLELTVVHFRDMPVSGRKSDAVEVEPEQPA
jgi:hypothetical protein